MFNLTISASTPSTVPSDADLLTRNQNTQPQELKNEFMDFVKTLYNKPGFGPVLNERLKELKKKFPDDLSVTIVDAYLGTLQGGDDAKASTQQVIDFLNAHPLEALAEGRRANNRQRKEASGRLAVWMIAKSLIGTEQWDSQGKVLAKNALEAAKRQTGFNELEVISNEWASLAIKAGDKDQAEGMWRDLLAAASVRPTSKATNIPNAPPVALTNRVPR